MLIKETVHHGDFFNEREVTIDTADFETFFDQVRLTCPYKSSGANEYEQECWEDLVSTGKGSIGWCRYEVIEDNGA